jgi:hypothetical protein
MARSPGRKLEEYSVGFVSGAVMVSARTASSISPVAMTANSVRAAHDIPDGLIYRTGVGTHRIMSGVI